MLAYAPKLEIKFLFRRINHQLHYFYYKNVKLKLLQIRFNNFVTWLMFYYMNLCLGSNHLYVFLNPLRPEKTPDLPENISWEFAQKEIAHAQGFSTSDASSLPKGRLPVKWLSLFF